MVDVKNYADPPEEEDSGGIGSFLKRSRFSRFHDNDEGGKTGGRRVGISLGSSRMDGDEPRFDGGQGEDGYGFIDEVETGRFVDESSHETVERQSRDFLVQRDLSSPVMNGGTVFFVSWVLIGLFMSVCGFIPMALLGRGQAWLKQAAIGVGLGAIASVAVASLLYLLVWPSLVASMSEELLQATQFSVVYSGS